MAVGCSSNASRGVFSVKKGMSVADVRKRAGSSPKRVLHIVYRGAPETCWVYPAQKKGASIDAIDFCFKHNRVERILIGMHA